MGCLSGGTYNKKGDEKTNTQIFALFFMVLCDSGEGGRLREWVCPGFPCLQQGAGVVSRFILVSERHIFSEDPAAKTLVTIAHQNLNIDVPCTGCRIRMLLGGNRSSMPETMKVHALCWCSRSICCNGAAMNGTGPT